MNKIRNLGIGSQSPPISDQDSCYSNMKKKKKIVIATGIDPMLRREDDNEALLVSV